MRNFNHIAVLIVLLLSFPAFGQKLSVRKDALSLTVYFRQSQSNIDLSFRENGRNITEFNRTLPMKRAGTIRDYLLDNTTLAPSQIKAFSLGVDRERFEELRQAGRKLSCFVSSRDGQKMAFEHMKDSLFRTPAIAFRSNLLMPLMNIGIEIPLSNRTSLEADFYSPWVMREWMDRFTTAHKNCFQLVLGTIGYRFWTGKLHDRRDGNPRYRLRGHSIGIVASGGVYDLERNWKGQQGRFAVLGVDYLYGLPLGRGRAHLEFNAGIGYGINWYNDYIVRQEGGKLINDGGKRVRNLPFPVRLGISIAVPVFRKNKTTESREEHDND